MIPLYFQLMIATAIVVSLSFTFCVTLVLIWFFYVDKRVKVYLMKQQEDTFRIVATKKISPVKTTFTYKEKEFTFELGSIIYNRRNRPEVYYDIDNVTPISFETLKKKKNPELFKSIVKAKIWGRMLGTEKTDIFIIIVLICAIGALGVGVYNSYLIVEMQQAIITLMNTLSRVEVVPK